MNRLEVFRIWRNIDAMIDTHAASAPSHVGQSPASRRALSVRSGAAGVMFGAKTVQKAPKSDVFRHLGEASDRNYRAAAQMQIFAMQIQRRAGLFSIFQYQIDSFSADAQSDATTPLAPVP